MIMTKIPTIGRIEAYAMVLDINNFTSAVMNDCNGMIAQDTRDVLEMCVENVEKYDGEVVGFMGDAFYALLFDPDDVFHACCAIAKTIDRTCEYIASTGAYEHTPGGPSVKIGVEYGTFEISTIHSRFLGEQRHVIGFPTIHATRIGNAGVGNRCHLGPAAAENFPYHLEGPYTVAGKANEPEFQYYELDLGDTWRAGKIEEGEDTYWG